MMKISWYKLALSLLLVTGAVNSSSADDSAQNFTISDASMKREGNLIDVKILFDLSHYKQKGDIAMLYTPCIVTENDTLELDPIGIYNRNRWYHYKRSGEMLGGNNAISMRGSKLPVNLDYHCIVPYEDWMNGSSLLIKADAYGCCRNILAQDDIPLEAGYVEFNPVYLYAAMPDIVEETVKEVKTREISGRAYVDFPVNQIVIYPDYHNNTIELGKILATIDPIKNDSDITVTSIFIKGTASPEGPYQNNVRLAKGRTEALTEYVRQQYNFPAQIMKTDYEPVDWIGLRDYLTTGVLTNGVRPVEGDLKNKEQILAIVNSDLESYARNQKIKNNYPQQYAWLLQNVYPTLRHSDYTIQYTIRNYTEAGEIAAVIEQSPEKVTLNEMYILAGSYQPGSDEFIEINEKIALLYPEEQIPNLNAGVAALQRGDLIRGEKFLSKAGESAEADLARANLAFLKGDIDKAKELYKKASSTLPIAKERYDRLIKNTDTK